MNPEKLTLLAKVRANRWEGCAFGRDDIARVAHVHTTRERRGGPYVTKIDLYTAEGPVHPSWRYPVALRCPRAMWYATHALWRMGFRVDGGPLA